MISEFAFGEAPFAADNAGIARAVIGAADAAVTSTSDPIRLRLFGASVSGAAAEGRREQIRSGGESVRNAKLMDGKVVRVKINEPPFGATSPSIHWIKDEIKDDVHLLPEMQQL